MKVAVVGSGWGKLASSWHRIRPHVLTAVAGMAFALLVWKTMSLEPRFIFAVAALVCIVSLGMVFVFRLEDFLVFATFFNIPFASFGKWLFVQKVLTVAKGITFGLAELLLFFGYLQWFLQVFVARVRSLPRLGLLDALFAVIFVSQCLSLLGAPDQKLAFFDIVYNLKFFLVYFYVAHKVERRHLKWIVVILLMGLVVESPIALYERLSGNVGIGRTKGDFSAGQFGNQYEVPGLEQVRAEGTTKDSHTLGEYFAMLLPLALTFAVIGRIRPLWRMLLGVLLLGGLGGLVVTFSRAGWFSFLLAAMVVFGVVYFSWRRGAAASVVLFAALLVSLAYPKVYEYAFVRVVEAPGEIMQSRYDLNWTALDVWSTNILFGYGPGNYMNALEDPRVHVIGPDWLPVHNAFLYIGSESGIFAAVAFFAMIAVAMKRCWGLRNDADILVRGLSVAIVAGLFAYVLDGLTNPTFREAEPYSLLWCYLGLSVALARMRTRPLDAPRNARPAPAPLDASGAP